MRFHLGLLACWVAACSAGAPKAARVPQPPQSLAIESVPGPAPAPAACPEGFQPSKQFVQQDWLTAYTTVKDGSNVWLDGDDPTTAEDARDGLCLGTSGIVGMPPNLKTTCTGDYWVISTDHLYYTDHTYVIVPRGTEAVVFDAGQIGGGLCPGEQSGTLSTVEVTLHGTQLLIQAKSESFEWSESGPVAARCQRSHTDVAEYRYDLSSKLGCEAFHVE